MLNCVIIDDEQQCINLLTAMLTKKFAERVTVLGSARSADEGIRLITDKAPDLVFLDVQMPGGTGLQMLSDLPEQNFSVVFTTAYSGYALQAIKKEAADYLLKPIALDELEVAMQRCEKRMALKKESEEKKQPAAISLPTHKGLQLTNLSDILRLEAQNNYTVVHMATAQKILVARTLASFEEQLSGSGFYRIHHSHLINLSHFFSYENGDQSYAVLSDGSRIGISRRRKSGLLKIIANKT